MPNRCSSPGCRINYAGEPYTPVFRIPRAPLELIQQWLKEIHRGVEEILNIHVFAKHFSEVDIETTYSIIQADGTITTQKREVPKLRKDALPMLLPNCPSHLSSTSTKSLTRLEKGTKEQNFFSMVLQQSLEQREIENAKFCVLTLQELRSLNKSSKLPKDCLSRASSETIIYFIEPKV